MTLCLPPEESRIPPPPCAPLNTPLRSQVILYCNRLTTWGFKKGSAFILQLQNGYCYRCRCNSHTSGLYPCQLYTWGPFCKSNGIPLPHVIKISASQASVRPGQGFWVFGYPGSFSAGLLRARSAHGTEPHTHGKRSTSFRLVVT